MITAKVEFWTEYKVQSKYFMVSADNMDEFNKRCLDIKAWLNNVVMKDSRIKYDYIIGIE